MRGRVVNDTWSHWLARGAVRPLLGTRVTPNHLTTLRLLTGLGACLCLALHPMRPGWGGLLWVLSTFLDRADGELARMAGTTSAAGHRYDYLVDNAVTALFFVAIGIGLRGAHGFGNWTVALGLLASGALLLCNWMAELYESRVSNRRILAGGWGFHADDALYLLGPAAWLGLLLPLLVASVVGTVVMAAVILVRLLRLFRRQARPLHPARRPA